MIFFLGGTLDSRVKSNKILIWASVDIEWINQAGTVEVEAQSTKCELRTATTNTVLP